MGVTDETTDVLRTEAAAAGLAVGARGEGIRELELHPHLLKAPLRGAPMGRADHPPAQE